MDKVVDILTLVVFVGTIVRVGLAYYQYYKLDDDRVQLIIGFHDKTNDPDKRYRGARYAKNYNGINEAVRRSDGKTVHIGFNSYVKKAEGKFHFDPETETFEGSVTYNGKTYHADDIPRLAADLYLADCEKKGYSPAYNIEGIVDHPNYYKLLADFSLYNSQGYYAPHQKVAYNMPDTVPFLDANGNKQTMRTEDYIKAELEKELAVRDSIAEALADESSEGIIPQFKEAVKKQQAVRSYKVPVTQNDPYRKPAYDEWDVRAALEDAMDHGDQNDDNVIKVGRLPNFIADLVGISGDFYIRRNHAYENMVSKEKAIEDGRPTKWKKKDRHFHNLGMERMVSAILALENPIVTIADSSEYNNPEIALILPVLGDDGSPLYAAMRFYSDFNINGKFTRKPHVVLTVSNREMIATEGRIGHLEAINNAVSTKNLLSFDKEKMRDYLAVIANLTRVGNVSSKSLNDNIARFREFVNNFRKQNKIDYKLPVGDSSNQRQAGKETLTRYQEALRGQREDTRIMEQEFSRLARAFETQARRSGKKDVAIDDLKAALKAEAKKHRNDQKLWEAEFNRLLRAYETSGRKIDRLEAQVAHQRQAAQAKVENRRKTEMRHKIIRFKEKLQNTLQRPTDNSYVPVDLISAMVDVCELIDTDSPLYKTDGSLNKAQQARNETRDRLIALKDEYSKLKTQSDPIYAGEFDEMIETYLDELRQEFSNKSLKEMSLDELRMMYEILRSIDETLQDARSLIDFGEKADVYEAGDAIIDEQRGITQSRKNGRRNAAERVRDTNLNYTLSPMRNVERMSGYHGDSFLLRLFKKFEQGIRKKNKFMMDAYSLFETD